MGVSRTGNSVKIWRNLPISNSKPALHHINAHTKFDVNPLMFTQDIIRKWNMDGQTYLRLMDGCTTDGRTDWWTFRQMDIQRETIIPHHYPVVGYKNNIGVLFIKLTVRSAEPIQTMPLSVNKAIYLLLNEIAISMKASTGWLTSTDWNNNNHSSR